MLVTVHQNIASCRSSKVIGMICFVTSRLDVIACVIASVSDVSSVLDDPFAVVAAVTSTIRVVGTVFVIVVVAGSAAAGLTHVRHLVGRHKIMLHIG